MSLTDPIGDLLTRIRNGQRARKATISTPSSKQRQRLLDVLEREGYIRGYSCTEFAGGKAEIEIELKYYQGDPVIRTISRVSKPGRRVFSSVRDLPDVSNGLGISIVSTPNGVLSDAEARDQNVGGEILCRVI